MIVEARIDGHWRRFDPEVDSPQPGLPSPTDIGHCRIDSTGFVTAAQAWAGYRRGDISLDTYGVDSDVPVFRGERFVFDEVIHEVAHRFGDELLLWDSWGRMGEPGSSVSDSDAHWLDEIAGLLISSDDGDENAERMLLQRYRADDGLHPAVAVTQASTYGDPSIEVNLGPCADRLEAMQPG